jgi:hypothetical protein
MIPIPEVARLYSLEIILLQYLIQIRYIPPDEAH